LKETAYLIHGTRYARMEKKQRKQIESNEIIFEQREFRTIFIKPIVFYRKKIKKIYVSLSSVKRTYLAMHTIYLNKNVGLHVDKI